MYEVILIEVGRDKLLEVVKIIKEILKLGLKEAKDLMDSAPCLITSVETLEEAQSIKAQFEKLKCQVDINLLENEHIENQSDSDCDGTDDFVIEMILGDVLFNLEYYCVIENKAFGPINIQQFANMARYGIVDSNTMVSKEGMPDWVIASSISELKFVLI